MHRQLSFHGADEVVPPFGNPILSLEKRATSRSASLLQRLESALRFELRGQRVGNTRLAPRVSDLTIKLLQFPLQRKPEVVGPAFQFDDFLVVPAVVSKLDVVEHALNDGFAHRGKAGHNRLVGRAWRAKNPQ